MAKFDFYVAVISFTSKGYNAIMLELKFKYVNSEFRDSMVLYEGLCFQAGYLFERVCSWCSQNYGRPIKHQNLPGLLLDDLKLDVTKLTYGPNIVGSSWTAVPGGNVYFLFENKRDAFLAKLKFGGSKYHVTSGGVKWILNQGVVTRVTS